MTIFEQERVSTADQNLRILQNVLRAVRHEKSGTDRGSRTEMQIPLKLLREVDTLVVMRVDEVSAGHCTRVAGQGG